jgi:membrane fusion protein
MSNGLFRSEALEAQDQYQWGDLIQIQPIGFGLLTLFAAVFAGSLLTFGFCGEYTRKSHVSGYLEPDLGLVKVLAPEDGTLIEKRISEGQEVEQGDALYVLSTERSSPDNPAVQTSAIARLQDRRLSLEQELNNQAEIDAMQERALAQRIRGLEASADQLRAEVDTQQARLTSARRVAEQFAALESRKFVAAVQALEKHDQWLDQKTRLQDLQHRTLNAERELADARAELAMHANKTANRRAAIGRDISSLIQDINEHESKRDIVVTAPSSGTVTAILGETGQHIRAASPLLSILPAGAQLQAQLLVPSRAIGFIAPNQTVAIRYQAFPYERFGSQAGRVAEISKTLLTPGDSTLPVPLKEAMYRVTVKLASQTVTAYRQPMPLQAGMLLDADVWLDRRRIIDWVFDPILALAGRL